MNQGVAEDCFMSNASFSLSWIDQTPLNDLDFLDSIS